jgi:hypothetical protein
MFSGEDGKITLEYVDQFILQCGEANTNDVLKLIIFSLSLCDTDFIGFTSLVPNSIFSWAQLEQKFYEYFYFSVNDRRRRPEEGECEPIKIPRGNLTYVPNLTRHTSLLARPKPHSYQ